MTDIKNNARLSEPWDSNIELYIHGLRQNAEINTKKHDAAGYYFKKRRTWFGLPTTIVPLVMAPVTLVLGGNHPLSLPVSAAALLVSGLSSGIYDFFSYGEQTSNNFNCSASWSSLMSEIDEEMVKSRQFRQPAGVFMAKIQMKFDAITHIAPVIPRSVLIDVEKELIDQNQRQIQIV